MWATLLSHNIRPTVDRDAETIIVAGVRLQKHVLVEHPCMAYPAYSIILLGSIKLNQASYMQRFDAQQ